MSLFLLNKKEDLYNWFMRLVGPAVDPDALAPARGPHSVLPLAFNRDTGGLLVSPPIGQGTILPSASRTATPSIATLKNPGCRGVLVIIDVTVGATHSIVPKIQAIDPVSGGTVDLLTGAAITGTGRVALRVYPGLTAAANLTVSDVLPRSWTVSMAHGNANAATYSVGYSYLP